MPRLCLLQTKLCPVKAESKEHVEVCSNVRVKVCANVSVKVCANVSVKVATLLPVRAMSKKNSFSKNLGGWERV